LVVFEHGEFDKGDEVVPAAEEHDRKGKKDRNQEKEVYREEENAVYFVVTERGEKIGLNSWTCIVVAQYAHQQIGKYAKANATERRPHKSFIRNVAHTFINGKYVDLIVEG
jgi:hypothetical protein